MNQKLQSFLKTAIIAVTMIFTAVIADAQTPLHMAFMDNEGIVRTIEAKTLSITVSGDKLIAENGSENLELSLSKLVKMYFTNTVTGMDFVSVNLNDGEVMVYNTDGTLAGRYDSAADAMAELPKGIYVFVTTENKSLKIAVQ